MHLAKVMRSVRLLSLLISRSLLSHSEGERTEAELRTQATGDARRIKCAHKMVRSYSFLPYSIFINECFGGEADTSFLNVLYTVHAVHI